MLLSGSIGITILKKDNKIIILLADDHSSKTYCHNVGVDINPTNHINIKNFLKKELHSGNQILLEEVERDNFELEELWPGSPHTQDLKNLFLTEDNITGIDIRPYLVPFSWEIVETDERLGNMSIKEYLSNLDQFFRLKGTFYDKVFYPIIEKVKIYNRGNELNLKYIKLRYLKIKKDTIDNNKLIYYYKNKKEVLLDISQLCDEIMELYTLINTFTNDNKSIIHTGLYHSTNILKWLMEIYKFKVIYKNGVNNLNNFTSTTDLPSCIYLPGLDKFGFKD